MPHFAVNLTFLFTEMPFMERFSAARDAGFHAVEFMFPYDFDMGEIKARLKETGQQLILCNLPAGNWAGGDRGTACNPERKAEFREGVARGIDAAKTLGFDRMNCLVGLKPEALSDEEAWETMAENIRFASVALGREGIRLVVEPINHFDVPGFALNTCARTLEMIDEGGPSQCLSAARYLPRPARGRRCGGNPPRPSWPGRPYPDRRLPGPSPARDRRDGFPVPASGDRPHRLSGIRFHGVHPSTRHTDLAAWMSVIRIFHLSRLT